MSYHFAYLILNLILATIWFAFFLHRKDLRHKMILLSLLIGFIGPLSEYWYLQDYWRPQTITGTMIGIEDYFFGFFIAGIGSVIYEELFGKRLSNRYNRKHNWALFSVFLGGLGVILFGSLFYYFKINSIYASIIGFLALAFVIIFYRRDLWIDAVVSGLLCGTVLFACYMLLLRPYPELFIRWWMMHHISGITFYKVPIEELLWAFGWGMLAGPMYEFYAGITLQKIKPVKARIKARKRR